MARLIQSDANSETEFVVNGTAGAIPDVNFDIGESYAGKLHPQLLICQSLMLF